MLLMHDQNFRQKICLYKQYTNTWVTSGFRREVDGNCALLGYFAASRGNFLPTFRDNLCSILKGQWSKKTLQRWEG